MGAMSLENVASTTGLPVSAANADTRNRLEIEISCLLTATSFERLQFGLRTVRQRITVQIQNHGDELVIAHQGCQIHHASLSQLVHGGLVRAVTHLLRVKHLVTKI